MYHFKRIEYFDVLRESHSLTVRCVQVAIGGWGDTTGFDVAAATDVTRKHFAQNVKRMVEATGADGRARDCGTQP